MLPPRQERRNPERKEGPWRKRQEDGKTKTQVQLNLLASRSREWDVVAGGGF